MRAKAQLSLNQLQEHLLFCAGEKGCLGWVLGMQKGITQSEADRARAKGLMLRQRDT